MMRPLPAWLAVLLLLFACGGTSTRQQSETKNKLRKHVMVQFTDFSLHPSTAQVLEGGTVSWVNYASEYEGSVVFSDSVAAAFTCSDLRPNWMKTGTGYQSIPIQRGGAAADLQVPCPLRPGEYEYEIWLFSGGGGSPAEMADPESRLEGRIVVQ